MRTYHTREVLVLLKIRWTDLDHWATAGWLVIPGPDGNPHPWDPGTGRFMIWSPAQFEAARRFVRLKRAGLTLPAIRKAMTENGDLGHGVHVTLED